LLLAVTVMAVATGAAAATGLGGAAALVFRRRLSLFVAFSAGAVIGLAFFDLIPEAMTLGWPNDRIVAFSGAGFFAYLLIDRFLLGHDHTGEDHDQARHRRAGAGTLSLHSFMDGVALGIGFEASIPVGIVVAAAILAHDAADGMNTVSLVLRRGGSARDAQNWLAMDALAPLAGAALSLFFAPNRALLAPVLAVLAGFFLYIGACELLPGSVRQGGIRLPTLATLCGAAFLYGLARVAG
jgi:ZIP family zinc transporter